jgi:hypothetical protein
MVRGKMSNACNILVGKSEAKGRVRRPTLDWRIILNWILGI